MKSLPEFKIVVITSPGSNPEWVALRRRVLTKCFNEGEANPTLASLNAILNVLCLELHSRVEGEAA
jgi:hypothetical protein